MLVGSVFVRSVFVAVLGAMLVGALVVPSQAAASGVPPSGPPPRDAPIRPGSYFSYPMGSQAEKLAIRDRVLAMIDSTWGAYPVTVLDDANKETRTEIRRGSIRIATWSFNDWQVTRSLVAARDRGASVQVVVARKVNQSYQPWMGPAGTRAALGPYPGDLTLPVQERSFAQECSGACRGQGGTAHSKYFLFDDVGRLHARNIVVQSSMNLTAFGYERQWNQATVLWDAGVHATFLRVFEEAASLGRLGSGLRRVRNGDVESVFFPNVPRRADPVLAALDRVDCRTGTNRGRVRVRLVQYAIYEQRGTTIAKRLRQLWNAGCDVKMIYSLSSRPVLAILRARTGRGPIPVRQSVVRNAAHELVRYNHSKWVAVATADPSRRTWTVLPGSANLSDFGFGCDEQMQQLFGGSWTAPFLAAFDKTWRERTSQPPAAQGATPAGARAGRQDAAGLVADEPVPSTGRFRYLEGD